MLSTTQPSTKRIRPLIFRRRFIFIYIYPLIEPGQYLKFWNNLSRYLFCFKFFSDTASHKEIWDLKLITEKSRNYLTPTSLEFFLKKTLYLWKVPQQNEKILFCIFLTKATTKRIKQIIFINFPIFLFMQTFPWPC